YIIGALVDGAWWGDLAGLAVDAGGGRQRELALLGDCDRTRQHHADGRKSDEKTQSTPPIGTKLQPYRVVSPLNTNFWIRLPSCTSVTKRLPFASTFMGCITK